MSTWTTDELARLDATEELQISSRRADGSLRPYVTIWVVRSGERIYVRSAYGAKNPWFVRATASGSGRADWRRMSSLRRRTRRLLLPSTPRTTRSMTGMGRGS